MMNTQEMQLRVEVNENDVSNIEVGQCGCANMKELLGVMSTFGGEQVTEI